MRCNCSEARRIVCTLNYIKALIVWRNYGLLAWQSLVCHLMEIDDLGIM